MAESLRCSSSPLVSDVRGAATCDVLAFRCALRFLMVPMSMAAQRCVDVVDISELQAECLAGENVANAVGSVAQ